MERVAALLALFFSVCASVLAAGCGGASVGVGFDIDGRPLGRVAPSPFAGFWAGDWSEVAGARAGTIDLTISPAGAVTVEIRDGSTGAIARGVGKISSGGSFSGTYRFPGGPRLTVRGTLAIDADARLRGSIERFEGARSAGAVTLDLVRQE
jgi:hypothetical protein